MAGASVLGAVVLVAGVSGTFALTRRPAPAEPVAVTASPDPDDGPVTSDPAPQPTAAPPDDGAPGADDTPEAPSVGAKPPAAPTDRTPPPPVAVTSPASGALGNDAAPLFTARGEPGAQVELSIVEGPSTAVGSVRTTIPASASWELRAPGLADGDHVVRLVQVGPAGNRSSAVDIAISIGIVALPPVLTPPAGPAWLLPAVTGTAEPGPAVQLRRASGGVIATTTAADDGSCSVELPDPGASSIMTVARQTDAAGNVQAASASQTVVVERPDVLQPADGSALPSAGDGTVVDVRSDGASGRYVQVVLDGSSTGNHHLLLESPLTRVTPPLADGAHTIALRYPDPATGRVGATTTVSFTIG